MQVGEYEIKPGVAQRLQAAFSVFAGAAGDTGLLHVLSAALRSRQGRLARRQGNPSVSFDIVYWSSLLHRGITIVEEVWEVDLDFEHDVHKDGISLQELLIGEYEEV